MKILAVILAILEVIPIFDKWFSELSLQYIKSQKEKGNVQFQDAIKTALTGNTKDLQSSIGAKLK